MASHLIGDRTSTPDSSAKSTLRPPSASRGLTTSHHIRASADMSSSLAAPLSARTARPRSEIFFGAQSQNPADDALDHASQKWLADIDQYETTLEEMAAATLDRGFKGELSSIEQWFRILSEAEKTAALYSLLQQTTQVQIRFFIQVLQQMSRNNPVSSILSPASFGETGEFVLSPSLILLSIANVRLLVFLLAADPMSSRLNEAMSKLHVDSARNSLVGRSPLSPGNKRNSGLDSSTINAMFPDAAAVIAKKKAEFTQQAASSSPNRHSSAFERHPLVTPVISAIGSKDSPMSQPPSSPWRRTPDPQSQSQPQPPIARPKSSSSQPQPQQQQQSQQQQQQQNPQPPMGQFSQPPPSAGLRSPPHENIRNTTITVPDLSTETASLMSPYNIGASWASMTNTPMMSSFSQAQVPSPGPSQADMVANATAMKLAALSTVNGRFALDDARKYRRTRSNDNQHAHNNGGSNHVQPQQQQQQQQHHQQQQQHQHHYHHQQQQQQHHMGNNISDPSNNLGFMQPPLQPLTPSITTPGGIPGTNVIMVNDAGQIIDAQQLAALQAQQQAAGLARRSRPPSPAIVANMHHNGGIGGNANANPNLNPMVAFTSPQNNGFLAAYDMNSWFGNPSLLSDGGYLSDHSELNRGRSPRGRRGTSKPPEDPTDPALLRDIPGWLRSLRLHKYTENLKDLKWSELVELDDQGLEARGVNALGARNKMLKVFEQVKEAKKEGKLNSIL
ncbi:Flap-structured DNA-binding and RNA-binding protein [Ascosphaera pollenicola]|nr:Flap-structured DNA-binding and RNA-binding protein [Ascosphaera pollenicola]